jgi:hypothetical protein
LIKGHGNFRHKGAEKILLIGFVLNCSVAGIMPETSDEEWAEDSSGDRAQKKSIWNDFSQQGYVTYFSEDSIHYELFGRKRNPPFDHSLL